MRLNPFEDANKIIMHQLVRLLLENLQKPIDPKFILIQNIIKGKRNNHFRYSRSK